MDWFGKQAGLPQGAARVQSQFHLSGYQLLGFSRTMSVFKPFKRAKSPTNLGSLALLEASLKLQCQFFDIAPQLYVIHEKLSTGFLERECEWGTMKPMGKL